MPSLKILVVDDDVDNAESLGELFAMEGHDVSVVHSGQAAIDAHLKASFDLAFMDVMMPGKNGVESFIEIRRMKPEAKVFMMTGYSVEELLQQAANEGALGVIEKPFDAQEILRMTENVGRGGLLVTSPATRARGLGDVIHSALANLGLSTRLVKDARQLDSGATPEEIVVLDTQSPLIDSVSCYTSIKRLPRAPTTIIVPPDRQVSVQDSEGLWDVGITGILNKPFDPLSLINRLPQLAA